LFVEGVGSNNCVGASYVDTTSTSVTRVESENCNTGPCSSTWSSCLVLTNPGNVCTADCGGGTQEERSDCLDAEEMWSTLCEGMNILCEQMMLLY